MIGEANKVACVTVILFSTVAHSSPINYTIDGGGAVFQLSLSPINDLFSGSISISNNICSLNCSFAVDATLSDDLSNITLSVNSANISGNLLCNTVSLAGFPWSDSILHAPLPFNFVLNNVTLSSICGACDSQVSVTVDSGAHIDFTQTGSCTVSSTLSSTHTYELWH